MPRRPAYFLAPLLFAAAGCSHRPPLDSTVAQPAIQAAYDAQNAAYKAKDVNGAVVVLTPDYVDSNKGQDLSRDAYETLLGELFHAAKSLDVSTKISDVECTPNNCTVTAERDFKAVLPPDAKAKPGTADRTVASTEELADTWVNSGGKWLKQASVVNSTASS